MRIVSALLLLVFLLTVAGLGAPTASAQKPGDAVYPYWSGGTTILLATDPSGKTTTLMRRVGNARPSAFTAAPLNDGLIFIESVLYPSQVLQVHGDLSVSTIATLPKNFTGVPTLLVEQDSDITLLLWAGSNHGVYRQAAGGGPIKTVAHNSMGASFWAPFAMIEDPATGDLLVLDWAPAIHRITPQGKITSVAMPLPPRTVQPFDANACANPATGTILFTYLEKFLGVDARTGVVTTMGTVSGVGQIQLHGIDVNPARPNSFYVSGLDGRQFPPMDIFLLDFDAGTSRATTLMIRPSVGFPDDVVTWRSRTLSGLNRPVPGAGFAVRLSLPAEGGELFAAGAALGTRPGIPVGGSHRIPLNPDGLFLLSRQAPAVFAGFDGKLDAAGETTLTIRVPRPPSLRGLRFYLAAVTYRPTGIRTITQPFGVTID